MKDPKEIAAGILARGKDQGGGVLCIGCHIGYLSPTCPTHGQMKEAHDRECREHTEKVMAYQSVTELCAKHGNLGEYIAQLEKQRDQALASFKNFHRSLCARFGYVHDEADWQRDQVSLEEHIAKLHSLEGAGKGVSLTKEMEAAGFTAFMRYDQNEILAMKFNERLETRRMLVRDVLTSALGAMGGDGGNSAEFARVTAYHFFQRCAFIPSWGKLTDEQKVDAIKEMANSIAATQRGVGTEAAREVR